MEKTTEQRWVGYSDPMHNPNGVRNKVIIAVTAIIVIFISFLAVIFLMEDTKRDEAAFYETGVGISKKTLNQVGAHLEPYENLLDLIAADVSGAKTGLGVKSKPQMLGTFENTMANTPALMNIYMGGADGAMTLVPKTDLPSGYDPRERPWYQNVVKTKKFAWSEPYLDASTGKMIISNSEPVYDATGNLLGVVGMDIDLNVFLNSLNNLKVGKQGYVGLVDKEGNILNSKDQQSIGKPMPIIELSKAIKEGKVGVVKWTQRGADGKSEQKMATLMKDPKMGWTAITVMDENGMATSAKSAMVMLALVGALMILLSNFAIIKLMKGENL